MKRFTKLAAAAALCVLGASAHADSFYVDANGLYSGADVDASHCSTCSGTKDQFTEKYQSSSVIYDTNHSFDGVNPATAINAGDKIVTNAGLAAGGGIAKNAFTGLNPGGLGGGNPDAGFQSTWGMTFSVTGLTGAITSITNGSPWLQYYDTGAVLHLYIYTAAAPSTLINFMDIDITGGGTDGQGTALTGSVDFSNIDPTVISSFGNLFHSTSSNCNGSNGFYDIWSACGLGATPPIELAFDFYAHFDTDVAVTDFAFDAAQSTPGTSAWSLTSNHDGSGTFNIPEPTSLALVGLGLVGVGFVGRRRGQVRLS